MVGGICTLACPVVVANVDPTDKLQRAQIVSTRQFRRDILLHSLFSSQEYHGASCKDHFVTYLCFEYWSFLPETCALFWIGLFRH